MVSNACNRSLLVRPFPVGSTNFTNVLVHQRCALQCLAWLLMHQIRSGELAQLVVHERH